MEFLRFTFESVEHFIGVFMLIALVGVLAVGFVEALRGKS